MSTQTKGLPTELDWVRLELSVALDRLAEMRKRHEALVAAARRLEVAANTVVYCYTRRPENFASALQAMNDDAAALRDVLAEAGAT